MPRRIVATARGNWAASCRINSGGDTTAWPGFVRPARRWKQRPLLPQSVNGRRKQRRRRQHVEAGPLRQPGPDLGVLVGAGVVHHQKDVQGLGHGRLDLAQKAQELLMPVAGLALGDPLPSGHVQSGKQGGGSVADGVVGDAFHVAKTHGQQGLGAVQSLDLGLLIDAVHHRLVGRIQVQADDVANLFDKERVGGELVAVRLPRSGSASAGEAAPRRSAASGERWFWRCRWQQRGSAQTTGCCHRWAWSAGPG